MFQGRHCKGGGSLGQMLGSSQGQGRKLLEAIVEFSQVSS